LPEVPTFKEAGLPEIMAPAWFGFLGPKGMPDSVIKKLEKAVDNALKDERLRSRLLANGTTPRASSAEELGNIMTSQFALWGPVVERLGIKLDR
jgi:tripartite-type tricarboxylate transporter receptor subunit TctC